MTRTARTVLAFSIYLFLLGLVLTVVPNALLALFSMDQTDEVWIRVVGMLVLLLGYYYGRAARMNLTAFFRWTVHARLSVPIFLIAFVLLGFAPPILVLFGVIDAAAACWTAIALRQEDRARTG